jgi:hypothetical protein
MTVPRGGESRRVRSEAPLLRAGASVARPDPAGFAPAPGAVAWARTWAAPHALPPASAKVPPEPVASQLCATAKAGEVLDSAACHRPGCVTRTTLSRTVMVPVRAAVPSFGATVNDTGLSPLCGMDVVIVIQGTLEVAVQTHAS